jgi:hypothetical protein
VVGAAADVGRVAVTACVAEERALRLVSTVCGAALVTAVPKAVGSVASVVKTGCVPEFVLAIEYVLASLSGSDASVVTIVKELFVVSTVVTIAGTYADG